MLGTEELARRLCRTTQYDLVHSHWEATAGLVGLRLQKRLKMPHVCTVRGRMTWDIGRRPGLDARLRRSVLSGSTRLLTVSKALAEFLQSESIRNDTSALYNGVDQSVFFPRNGPLGSGDQQSRIVFLFVGFLEPNKGVLDILSAFKNVSDMGDGVMLDIVGEGSLRGEIVHRGRETCFGEAGHFERMGET